jgi:hypothetical protein
MTRSTFKTSDRTVSHTGVVKHVLCNQRALSLSRSEKNSSIRRDLVLNNPRGSRSSNVWPGEHLAYALCRAKHKAQRRAAMALKTGHICGKPLTR